MGRRREKREKGHEKINECFMSKQKREERKIALSWNKSRERKKKRQRESKKKEEERNNRSAGRS